MPTRQDFHKIIIGRAESLSFVDAQIFDVPAKIDTGAYRNAIHASDIRIENGELVCTLLGGHPLCDTMSHEIRTKVYEKVNIRNSFGINEERYEINLKVKLGPKLFSSSFSLADRSKNVYPILIGRKLLNRRFMIDTDKTSVSRKALKEQYDINFPKDEEDGRDKDL
jgi:hypothetical protein